MPTPNLLESIEKPQVVPLVITRGDSLRYEFTVRDGKGGSPVALTGKTGAATVRRALDDVASPFSLTVAVSQAAAGSSGCGEIVVSATGQQTALFPIVGVWDLQISDGSPTGVFRKTLVIGQLVFRRDVTLNG